MATRLPTIHNHPSKVQLDRPGHVVFEYEDLEKFDQFAKDFGMIKAYQDSDTILYRGYGKDPYTYVARKSSGGNRFIAGAWVAQSQADFDKAASIPGAVTLPLSPYPGGGQQAVLKSPAGFEIRVVYGVEERKPDEIIPSAQAEQVGPLNGSYVKKRLGRFSNANHAKISWLIIWCEGEFQRFHIGPAMIHKLGHYGFVVPNWDEEVRWYTSHFNLVPTDVQHLKDNENLDVLTFLHLDLGERYSDHHSLFFSRARPDEKPHLHHTSFEIEDFDTQLLGHEWLASKSYHCVWGVGRHILGSQIFDYWKDTGGFTIEHYADGDIVNTHTASNKRSPAGPLAVWGPEMPATLSEGPILA